MAASRPPLRQGSFSASRELQPWDYVPPSVLEAEKFLRAANEVEHQRPRVSYLCKIIFDAAQLDLMARPYPRT